MVIPITRHGYDYIYKGGFSGRERRIIAFFPVGLQQVLRPMHETGGEGTARTRGIIEPVQERVERNHRTKIRVSGGRYANGKRGGAQRAEITQVTLRTGTIKKFKKIQKWRLKKKKKRPNETEANKKMREREGKKPAG